MFILSILEFLFGLIVVGVIGTHVNDVISVIQDPALWSMFLAATVSIVKGILGLVINIGNQLQASNTPNNTLGQ